MTYGLLGVGGVRLAVPLDVLREVVPRPADVVPLPAAAAGLLGAVDVRGDVVPLLDPVPVLGLAPAAGGGGVVAVLVHDGSLLGLAVDSVHGVTGPADDDLQAVRPAGLPLRASWRAEDGVVTGVLDVGALVAASGVPLLDDRSATAHPDGPPARPDGEVRPVIRLRCGPYQLCVPAVEVHAVLPALRPRPSPMDGPLCRGVTAYRDVEIAVVDLAALLGLGRTDAVHDLPGVVLRLDRGFVALAVSQVIDIEPLDVSARLPVPTGSVTAPERYAGLLPHPEHGQVLLVDTGSLLADPDLAGMAALNRPVGPAPNRPAASGTPSAGPAVGPSARGDVRADDRAYLTYVVGPADDLTELATLLDQVGEIVAFPTGRAVVGTGLGHVLGVFVHRGDPVSLVCLSTLVGRPRPDVRAANVLLVGTPCGTVGFVVSGLRAIERATWSQTAGEDRADGADLTRAPVLRVTAGGAGERLLPALDLVAVAGTVTGAPAAGVPAPRPAVSPPWPAGRTPAGSRPGP